jgi:hypothetical protein
MAAPFREHGFMLSWTQGDPTGDSFAGPFMDASQDLVDLYLTAIGTNYQAPVTRLVGGFSNPIDAAIWGNRIYVIEYGGNQGIWEISFPPAPAPITASWSDGKIVIGWSVAGTLQTSSSLHPAGSWSTVAGAVNTPTGGTYTNSPGASPTYYRLQQQW